MDAHFLSSRIRRLPWHCSAWLLVGMACAAAAQSDARPTLAQALDAAWAFSVSARSSGNRLAELDARQRATESLLASPASITLRQRSDQANSNLGFRESEAELALPLWNPGVRSATRQQVLAERNALTLLQASDKLKLAGELRELVANAAQAVLERDLAARKQEEARTLALDVQRRVNAGDSARIDALQAVAAERLSAVQAAQAEVALSQIQNQWRALTGLVQIAQPEESAGSPQPDHPATAAHQAGVQTAQAKLALTEADRRDPLELGLGITRERDRRGESAQNSLQLSLRIPLGGDNRNAPRLAAARAELDAAQAELDAAVRQVQSGIASAQAALESARRAQALAAERAALSSQAQALIAKSYRLGESDLPTRLRLEADKFDADLALARATADTNRAVARLNQAYGLLP